jgi:uncharacterized membrane protein YgcG
MSYGLRDRRGRLHGFGLVDGRGLGDNVVGQTSGNYTWNGRQWVLSSTGLPEFVTQANLAAATQESQAAGIPVNSPLDPMAGMMTYDALLAQAKLQNCDPRDSACVGGNAARGSAAQQYWVNHNGLVPAGTVLTFPALTAAQIEYYGGGERAAVDGLPHGIPILTPSVTVAPVSKLIPASPSAPPAKTGGDAASRGAPPAAGSGGGGSAAGGGASSSSSFSTIGGFDISSVPWWAWAGGAVAAFFAFRGKG